MPYLRRKPRQTKGKGSLQHSGTFVHASLGPGSAPASMRILETEGGARSTDGSEDQVTHSRTTVEVCNIGDLVKFINVFIEAGPRLINDTTSANVGWCEWAVKIGKESDIAIPITSLGTQTLGVVANRMFPGQILLSGNIPVGARQSAAAEIKLKIPKKFQFQTQGNCIDLWIYFRTSSSTDTGTADFRAFTSYIYNSYN